MIPNGGYKVHQQAVIMGLSFPEKQWYENLLLDTMRQTYDDMTPSQKQLVRLAYTYGVLTQQDRDRQRL